MYGESAGAISSIQHVINEESSKYFSRAIVQSNPLAIPFKEKWEAAKQGYFSTIKHGTHFFQGNMFAKEIGCPDFNMTCMRSKSVKEVVEATDRVPIIINPLELSFN